MYEFLPIFVSKKRKKNTLAKKPTFQKNLLKPTKYQHFDLPKSSQKNVIFFLSSNKQKRKKNTKKTSKNVTSQKHH